MTTSDSNHSGHMLQCQGSPYHAADHQVSGHPYRAANYLELGVLHASGTVITGISQW